MTLHFRIVLETSPQIPRKVKVPKRRRRSITQNSELIAFADLTDNEVQLIKKLSMRLDYLLHTLTSYVL